jgi:hypothetical protein
MPTERRGNGTWQDRCAYHIPYHCTMSWAMSTMHAPMIFCCWEEGALGSIFALDDQSMTALQLDSSPPSSQNQWPKMHDCTRGFCAVEQHKLLLAYHDCRAALPALTHHRDHAIHTSDITSSAPSTSFTIHTFQAQTRPRAGKIRSITHTTVHFSRLHSLHEHTCATPLMNKPNTK